MVARRSSRILRFGPYEFDTVAQELRKHGVRLKLQGQPLQLLSALLDDPGEVVSREELRGRLWPADTFVDFESGLNTAAKRLRAALSDSADQPVYIETVARTGYRFIAPVIAPVTAAPEISAAAVPPPATGAQQPRRRTWLRYTAVATAAGAAGFLLRPRSAEARWTFRQVTFRRGDVQGARFGPDGRSIVFSAQFEGDPRDLYLNNGVSPESRPLGLKGYSLLAVSHRGELALHRFGGSLPTSGGTLEKVPMNGGKPAGVDRDIFSADWAPDGASLALLRAAGGATSLEYPAGRTLYRAAGWLSSVRVSPDGAKVAFVDHPIRHDDSGIVTIVDRAGHVLGKTAAWDAAGGLAWRSADELWFTAARAGHPKSLWRSTPRGETKPLLSGPGVLTLADVHADGRALVLRQSRRLEMTGVLRGQPQRDLTWHDWSRVADISADGRYVLFEETGEAVGASGAAYLLDSDTGGVVRLGDGFVYGLSPDATRAVMLRREDRQRLLLTPIAGGAAQVLRAGLEFQWAKYFPDGQSLFALANEPKGPLRIYRVALDGSRHPLTPPGMVRHPAISRDGLQLAILSAEGRLLIYPADRFGPARPVALTAAHGPICWDLDHRHLFTQALDTYTQVPAEIFRVDTQTGEARLWKKVGPFDPMGVNSVTRIMISADRQSWVCNYRRALSELFQIAMETQS